MVAFLFNLVVMGAGAVYSYQQAPHIPESFVGPDGERVATAEGIRTGKTVFQSDALMNHGSVLGNGAYYGVDYTAFALDRKTAAMRELYAEERYGEPYDELASPDRAAADTTVREAFVERAGFFRTGEALGIEILQWLPFALAKTYHIDLGILWIATTWLGAGLFLPPLLTGTEPEGQARYVNVLLGALVVAVGGGFAGIWLGAQGYIEGPLWWLLGNEGLEYPEVGRVWQFGLLAGFGLWAVLVARAFRPLLSRERPYGLAHTILYAGGSIGLLFVAGMFYTPQTNIVVTGFWRRWVVHMWVEGAFEFFIVAVVGLTLVSMNPLSRRSAEKAVAFEALFVIILFEAIDEYRALATAGEAFPYTLPFAFIIASGAWNFLGAGVLGFFITLPLVNYYEHGTDLTVGHAHAAMFGALGFLAVGMATYVLRIASDPARWNGRRLRWSFWLRNAGLALMVFVSVLPVGFLQLETAFTEGYHAARSLAFYERDLVRLLFWARLPGDTMIVAGTLLYAYDGLRKRFVFRETTPLDGRSRVPAAGLRGLASEDDD